MLLREITKLRSSSRRIAITASTGIAALNIGGATLHSWAGIGLGVEPAKTFIGKVLGQPHGFEQVLTRWRKVNTLIVDERKFLDCVIRSGLNQRSLRSFHGGWVTF